MIEYIKGDLFSNKTDSLAHAVSADLKMGAGIAKAFNKKWGVAIRKQIQLHPELSQSKCVVVPVRDRLIYNLVTKKRYFQKPTLDSMEEALSKMFEIANQYESAIAMPKIGCGLDKLKWKDVKKLIKKHQGNVRVKVYEL